MQGSIPVIAAAAISIFSLAAGSAAQTRQVTHGRMLPWTFRADWNGGFSGWMSYPLAQDVGYDPSLYTVRQGDRTALLRNFEAYGEKQAWTGFVRPMRFWAAPSTSIQMDYRLQGPAQFSNARLILVGADGHEYSAALPSVDGEQTVRITAAKLGLNSLAEIRSVILEARLRNPPARSESRWMLEEFVLTGLRPKQMAFAAPRMDAGIDGADGTLVSREIVEPGSPLQIQLADDAPATVAVYDPAGAPTATVKIPFGQKPSSISLGAHPHPGLWRAEVSQGDAKTGFRFLVLGVPPAHGNLLFSEDRLRQLRHGEQYAGIRQQIHEHARELAARIDFSSEAGENIDEMASGPGLQAAYSGQLTPYLLMVEAYANAVAYNALDYRLNGDRSGLETARRALLAVAQWSTWSPRRFREHGMHTYYEVGCIAQRLAFGYDLIAGQLSSQEKSDVEQSFWKQAIEPVVREYFRYNRDPIAASNWMANSLGGALAAAVATAGDSPEWTRREAPAIADLEFAFEQALHGLFPGDGSEAEPAGYENFAMQGISWGMSSLADLGIQPQGSEAMLNGFWWPYYATVKPGTELDTGDFDGHLKGLSGFAWGAEHSGIPALDAFYRDGANLDLAHDASADQNGHHLEEVPGPLDLACCSEPARQFVPPPPSRIFPTRGSAVLRSGWGPDTTVISLRVGPWFNHEHHDEGSFQVSAFGQILVNEAGYASYYTDPHYHDYFTQAAGHNTLLIDGNAFSQGAFQARYWPGFSYPHLNASMLGDAIDYLGADLTSAYKGALQSYQRDYIFLKPDIFIVRDRVRSARPHQFSWLLHTSGEAKLVVNGAQASIQLPTARGVVSADLTSAATGRVWKSAEMPISILQFKSLDGSRIDPPQELRLDSQGRSAEFLVGMRLGLNQGGGAQLQSFNDAAGNGLRTFNGPSAGVIFRSGTGPLRGSALQCDGTVLVWHSNGEKAAWMAVDATSVEQAGQQMFHASTPVTVEWESTPSGVSLRLNNPAETTIDVYSAASPRVVELDGRPAAFLYKDQKMRVAEIPAGEHRLLIQ